MPRVGEVVQKYRSCINYLNVGGCTVPVFVHMPCMNPLAIDSQGFNS